jgi:hypothetical protein
MASYTYTKEKQDDQVLFTILSGNHTAASARLMVPTRDFESYAVRSHYRHRGLSYALTYAMLVYCRKKGYSQPQVSNAHGVLLTTLPKVGFYQVGPTRWTREPAASFRCLDVAAAIELCSRKLDAYGIRLTGPIKMSRQCIIL